MNLIKKMLAAPVAVLALWAVTAQATTDEAIAERLKPVAQVCITGEECAGVEVATTAAAATTASARSGKEIVDMLCHVCHTGAGKLPTAPELGNTAEWKARADEQGGLDALLQTAITGLNLMPPKGTCMDCSDDELLSAIKYMSGLE